MDRREFLLKSALMGTAVTLPFYKPFARDKKVLSPPFAGMWGHLQAQAGP